MPRSTCRGGVLRRPEPRGSGRSRPRARGWSTLIWGVRALYALYRIVARLAGSTDLPLGNCLVTEARHDPVFDVGFRRHLAGVALDRAAQCRSGRDGRRPARHAAGDRPDARRGAGVRARRCRLVTSPPSSGWARVTCRPRPVPRAVGDYFRWQLGWGLTDLQAASLVGLGLVGAVAWSRGTIRGCSRWLRAAFVRRGRAPGRGGGHGRGGLGPGVGRGLRGRLALAVADAGSWPPPTATPISPRCRSGSGPGAAVYRAGRPTGAAIVSPCAELTARPIAPCPSRHADVRRPS